MAEDTSRSRLRLVVVTHERKLLEQECDAVSIPASLGYVTILPQHAPLISTLAVGELSVRDGSEDKLLALAGGFFEVSEDVVTVLADSAELPEEIDIEEAKRERQAAHEAMEGAAGDELTRARRKLQHAETRIKVAGLNSRVE